MGDGSKATQPLKVTSVCRSASGRAGLSRRMPLCCLALQCAMCKPGCLPCPMPMTMIGGHAPTLLGRACLTGAHTASSHPSLVLPTLGPGPCCAAARLSVRSLCAPLGPCAAELTPYEVTSAFSTIDVQKAEAFSAADKERIHADIIREHHGLGVFNERLKLRLVLKPLSHAADVKRLAARAAGTQWTLDAVTAWMADTASRQRVLVIPAGAGAGKSTISAALVESAQRRARGSGAADVVLAHHFFKYNDNRRQDVMQIIRSLAFQLAERVEGMRKNVLGLPPSWLARMSDAERLFDELLRKPIATHGDGRNVSALTPTGCCACHAATARHATCRCCFESLTRVVL